MTQSLVPAGMLTGVQAYSAKLNDIAGLSLTQGDVLYWNGTHFVKLAAGTSGQVLITGGAGANPAWGTLTSAFSSSYTSAAQTVTSAGALTLAHGLGGMPSLVQCRLVFQNSVNGFTAGDELIVCGGAEGNSGYGLSLVPDATNLNIRFASIATCFNALNKGTGVNGNITNTDVKLVARAWK